MVNQLGDKSVYVERNSGIIYMGGFVATANDAFDDQSFELQNYAPKILPPIQRDEVKYILDWIAKDAQTEKPNRVALLYGSAGVGKSVVMHDVLLETQQQADYLVLGLKTDQIEFEDTEDLSRRMHLAKPIVSVIRDLAQKKRRVVMLIDQIDALSLSLSSNRTPLRSILKLIQQVKEIPHVRVVISCRPYDLDYDPILNNLNIPTKWELKKLSGKKVTEILKQHGLDVNLTDGLIEFLGNPLRLYLYLKVMPYGKLRTPVTEDVLYDELWRIGVIDIDVSKVNKERVLRLLDTMVETMYKRQELSVHRCEIETNYTDELHYLLSQELITFTSNGRVQFFHQTMFDYVYARRFVEKGQDLLKELSSQHQGLFSRAAVKSILTFLRETDSCGYIQTLSHLLFDKNEDGKEQYRFHLKSLALSNMTFFDEPKTNELQFIERKVFDNSLYMGVVFESVHSGPWLEAIWKIIEERGGWPSLIKDYKGKVITMCRRSFWNDPDRMLGIVFKILGYGNEDDKELIEGLVNYQYIDCNVELLIKLYRELGDNPRSTIGISLLKNIAKKDPAFVCNEFKKNVKEQLDQNENKILHVISFTHDEESLLEMLEKEHHHIAMRLYVDLLMMIMEATKYDFHGFEICSSSEFSRFQRVSGGHFYHNFSEDVVNKLIDDFLKNIVEKETGNYLSDFSKSNYECFVFIALYVYTEFPEKCANDIYTIICNRSVLSYAPCWVEYQALEALKASFSYMTSEQQLEVIKIAESLTEMGELHVDRRFREKKSLACYPICDLDLRRGKVLYALPKDFLRKYCLTAYQERLRIERKYAYKENGVVSYPLLENKLPFRSSSMCGWSSVGTNIAAKMSFHAWYISMTKFVNNKHTTDWERPSLMGQCQLFRKIVSENPDKYLSFVRRIAVDEKIQLEYVEAGLSGLLDAQKFVDAEEIFCCIVDQIDDDVNSTYRGFDIHSLLYSIDVFIKGDSLPKSVFEFLCNIVLNVRESEVSPETAKQGDIYNTAINQPRGHAAYMLVKSCGFEEYKEGIFRTLEKVAASASVYTRSAILLNMALLNNLDRMRNLELFKSLMHDYDVRLMSLPVHNYNPLVYFINYAIDDLMDFFKHAIDKTDCYKEQVIILWLAWSHNDFREDVKRMLDIMCERSLIARLSLIDFLGDLEDKLDVSALTYIKFLMSEKFTSPELGEAFDGIFIHANDWSDNFKSEIAQTYVQSSLSKFYNRGFVGFLAGYAVVNPVRTLAWLECILEKKRPENYSVWNLVTDVLIQSYNGIKSFNDEDCKDILEKAMDLMDQLMMSKDDNYLITNFIHKLDEG